MKLTEYLKWADVDCDFYRDGKPCGATPFGLYITGDHLRKALFVCSECFDKAIDGDGLAIPLECEVKK